jgi:3-methyladenine DNA glycosylase Tag
MAGPPERIKPESLGDYLEVMSKAVFQSGMSWKVVESKWPGTRAAFHNFEIEKVADLHAGEIEALGEDTRVIRNKRKLAAVVSNAQTIIDLDKQHGSFQKYLRSFPNFDAAVEGMRKDFKFLGPTGIYFFLYVVGEQVPEHEQFEAQYRGK